MVVNLPGTWLVLALWISSLSDAAYVGVVVGGGSRTVQEQQRVVTTMARSNTRGGSWVSRIHDLQEQQQQLQQQQETNCMGFRLSARKNRSKIDYDDADALSFFTDPKFGLGQRIASVQSLVVGAVSGSLAVALPTLIHDAFFNGWAARYGTVTTGLAQFEFDNDAAALMAGLFALVYRYCLRLDGDREQLKEGVVTAFVLTRTLSRITVAPTCQALPLSCGAPFGYLNWNMLFQLAVNGLESAILFGTVAAALDYCMERGWIAKFPG